MNGSSTISMFCGDGISAGLCMCSSVPSVSRAMYSTLGAVAMRVRLNSLSSRSRTMSIWSRPRNPQRKPKPRATDDSGW